jgi:hypothetical protein
LQRSRAQASLARWWPSVAPARRALRITLIAIVAVTALGLTSVPSALGSSTTPAVTQSAHDSAASRRVTLHVRPKIAIIVGPVAEYTADYKRFAAQAVAAAKRYRVDIALVETPNATWPRVRAALEGASLVVYLGHGNGYPSPYRSDPWPFSENGFGVNVPGARNNDDHQYFGEYYLRQQVRLAPNAIVILSHLCYASGNSEPGLPEDGQKVALQRVDNYAAGFIASGAAAVVADGRGSPAYYVDSVLSGRGTIASIWRAAATFNNHVTTFKSGRSPGFTGYVDPDTRSTGYYHSLVVRGQTRATDVLAGAGQIATGRRSLPPLRYSLLRATTHPATIGGLKVPRGPVAGKPLSVTLPIMSRPTSLPKSGLQLAVRWDPMQVDPVGTTKPTTGNAAAGNGSSSAGSGAQAPDDPNTIWIAPEEPGKVVETEIANVTSRNIQAKVMVPSQPGLYRLTIELANGDGAPLGPHVVTQPAAYLVTVPSRLDIGFTVASQVRAVVGKLTSVPVTVSNSGSAPWVAAGAVGSNGLELSAWLVPVSQPLSARIELPSMSIANLAPGASARLNLKLQAPTALGDYLLVLDVTRPDGTLLDTNGDAAKVVHVKVVPPPPAASPTDSVGISGENGGNSTASPKPSATPSPTPKGPQSPRSPSGS